LQAPTDESDSLNLTEIREGRGTSAVNETPHLYALLVLSVCASVMYSIRLAAGHEWGDDFGAYLHLAKNIQLGRPYDFLTPDMGAMTPPGFPLLMAWWSSWTGWELPSLKTINVLSWCLLAPASYRLARYYVSANQSLVVGIAVLCCPFFTFARHSLISDMPYAVVSTLCLCLSSALSRPEQPVRRFLLSCGLGAGIFIAFLFRPATVGLVAALLGYQLYILAHDYLRTRQINRGAVFTVTLLVGTTILFVALFPGPFKAHGGNAASAVNSYSLVQRGAEEFQNFANLFFGFIAPSWAAKVFLISVLAGATVGAATRKQLAPLHFFAVIYPLMIVLTPWNQGPRYLFPIVPVAFVFVTMLADFPARSRIVRWVLTSVVLIILGATVANGMKQINAARGYSADEIEHPDAVELVDWLKANTRADDKLCAFKPRAFLYLVQRRTADLGFEAYDGAGDAFLRKSQCSFAVTPNPDRMGSLYNAPSLRLASDPTMMKIFRNSTYSVYTAQGQNRHANP
jgi:hypothetical protein